MTAKGETMTMPETMAETMPETMTAETAAVGRSTSVGRPTTAVGRPTAVAAGAANGGEPDQFAQLAALTRSRALTYGLLARMFRVETDQAFVDELRAMRFPAKTGDDDVDEGYRLLAGYLSHAQDGMLTELAVDYVRAFIGGGFDGHAAAYPYESVYTSEKRLLMQDARDEVLAEYRRLGLDKSSDWAEAEDHVALELEFMQTTGERVAAALDAGDTDGATRLLETQRAFAERHLVPWVPAFARDVLRFARTDFFRGASRLLRGFVREDAAFLDELVGGEER